MEAPNPSFSLARGGDPFLKARLAETQGPMASDIAQQALFTLHDRGDEKEILLKKARLGKKNAASPLDDLAEEIANRIFQFLDPYSLKRMAQTSRRWHWHMQSQPLRPVLTLHQGCAPFNPQQFAAFLNRLASFKAPFGIDFKGSREQWDQLLHHPVMNQVNYLKVNLLEIENHTEVQRIEQHLLQVSCIAKGALSDLSCRPYQAVMADILQQVGALSTELRKNGSRMHKVQKNLSLLAQKEEEMQMLQAQTAGLKHRAQRDLLWQMKNCQESMEHYGKKTHGLEKGLKETFLFQRNYAKIESRFLAELPVFSALKVLDVRCRALEHLQILEQLIRHAPHLEAFRVPNLKKMESPCFNQNEAKRIYASLFQLSAKSLAYLNLSLPQNQYQLPREWCSVLVEVSNLRQLIFGLGAVEEDLSCIHKLYRRNPLEFLSLSEGSGDPCPLDLSAEGQEPLCPNLKRLQFFNATWNREKIKNILGHCPNLNSLVVIHRLLTLSNDGMVHFQQTLEWMSDVLMKRGVALECYLYVPIEEMGKLEELRSFCPALVFEPLETETAERLIHLPYQMPNGQDVKLMVRNSLWATDKQKIIQVSLQEHQV
ncbi:MAG: hypothetical protein K0S07_50 [Chlamydiales bacterium]|jgi:hypothetical protein|nr:hypothetical protein [Chlamydiales bacterium]